MNVRYDFWKKAKIFLFVSPPKIKISIQKKCFLQYWRKKYALTVVLKKIEKLYIRQKKCIVSNLTLELFCDMCEIWTPILIIQRRKSYKKNLPFLLHFFLLKRQLKNWCFTKKEIFKDNIFFSLLSPPKKLKKRKHHHQKILILTKKKYRRDISSLYYWKNFHTCQKKCTTFSKSILKNWFLISETWTPHDEFCNFFPSP